MVEKGQAQESLEQKKYKTNMSNSNKGSGKKTGGESCNV